MLTSLRVQRLATDKLRGRLIAGNAWFRCALGAGGIGRKTREGDGITPAGSHRLTGLWVRAGEKAPPRTKLPWRKISRIDGWCDDPGHRRYNRHVKLPIAGSSERLWRDDHIYDIVIETGWNCRPAIKGKGSAIFIHVARTGFTPTAGCVALHYTDLRRLLGMISSKTKVQIAC